jgi:hypothetical protein
LAIKIWGGLNMMRKGISLMMVFSILGLCASILLSSSCAALNARPNVVMYGNPFPAKAKDAHIDIYKTTKPDKKYTEIAEISCGDLSDKWNMEQILIKAREIGADGVIIIGKSGDVAVGVPTDNSVIAVSEGYGIKAIAIKYKN